MTILGCRADPRGTRSVAYSPTNGMNAVSTAAVRKMAMATTPRMILTFVCRTTASHSGLGHPFWN